VSQGQRIGAIGATGRATGPHLHWSMKWNDARIDPLLLAGGDGRELSDFRPIGKFSPRGAEGAER
jgi:murein DD-endopeptidase MepM/ murein hydrolase activator NlpD